MDSCSPAPLETRFVSEAPRRSGGVTQSDCPLCEPSYFDWMFAKSGRHFWRCQSCGLVKQHPLPTPEELRAYYEEEFAGGMYEIFTTAEQMKTMTARRRLRELKPHLPSPLSGRWLDVGCANGVFVREAAAQGVEAAGVELSQVAVDQSVAMGLKVHCGDIASLPIEESFDCITGFDILEHVLDPKSFLDDLVARLRPGGHIALTLPDKASLFARLMGKRWWFFIPEEHLHYFDQSLMMKLFEAAGLRVIHTGRTFKPLTFDYGLTQFAEYNPLIYRLMKMASAVLPRRLRQYIVPLYIGEMKIIGRLPA